MDGEQRSNGCSEKRARESGRTSFCYLKEGTRIEICSLGNKVRRREIENADREKKKEEKRCLAINWRTDMAH